jgi:WD40 repeat protein
MLRDLHGHDGAIRRLAFSPSQNLLASAGEDRAGQVIRIEDIAARSTARTLSSAESDLAYDLGGKPIVAGATDAVVRVWHASGGQVALTFRGRLMVNGVTFGPDGRLAWTGADRRIHVWDLAASGEESRPVPPHLESVRSLAFSPDGWLLSLAGRDGSVLLQETEGRAGQRPLAGRHDGAVRSLAFSADGQWLASAGDDEVARVWDAASGEQVEMLRGHAGRVTAVAFSPDGARLATAGDDETVRLWDRDGSVLRETFTGHGGTVGGVAFSPDGGLLAWGNSDRTVTVRRLTDGREWPLKGHELGVTAVAFDPNGHRLASASEDGTVKLWETGGGQEVLTLRGHTGPVTSLAFSRNGWQLASASRDGHVKIWDAPRVRE